MSKIRIAFDVDGTLIQAKADYKSGAKRPLLRNCVEPEVGLHILQEVLK